MKKQSIILATTLGLLAISVGSVSASAVSVDYSSEGQVEFLPGSGSEPVDPSDPTKPVTPINTIPGGTVSPGTGGPLSIDFASSLYFGQQLISSSNKTYYALAQSYLDSLGATVAGPNYVQVTDSRGTVAGWTLTVKQDAQFTSATASEALVGASVTLGNGGVVSASSSTMPTGATALTLVPGASATVMSAAAGQGAGTYLETFGTSATAGTSVSLFVPGAATKLADKYNTSFTWTLNDVPG